MSLEDDLKYECSWCGNPLKEISDTYCSDACSIEETYRAYEVPENPCNAIKFITEKEK